MGIEAQSADKATEKDLAGGMASWASGSNPWVHMLEPNTFSRSMDTVHQIASNLILSAHFPPLQGKTEHLLDLLSTVLTLPNFVVPSKRDWNRYCVRQRLGAEH